MTVRCAQVGMRVVHCRISLRRLVLFMCGVFILSGTSLFFHHTFYPDYNFSSTQLSAVCLHDFFWLDWVAGDYFQPRNGVVSPLPRFYIQPSHGCNDSTFLVVLVISPAKDFSRRKLIRSTWGEAIEDNQWPKTWLPVYVEVFFVLGFNLNYTSSSLETLKSGLTAEAEFYKDIIVGDFTDSYKNLTLKTLTGLNWARQRCSHTEFVMKVDHDTLVDFPRLTDYLLQHRHELRNAVIGKLYFNAKRRDIGKWKVLPSEYPFSLYPTFAGGPCYLISTDVVGGLVNVSQYLPLFVMEDVHVTGILARALGVRRLHLQQLQNWKTDSLCDLLEDKYKVSTTQLSEDDLKRVWTILKTGQCSSSMQQDGHLRPEKGVS